MRTFHLYLKQQKIELVVEEGQNIMEVLRQVGLYLYMPCNGNGTCKKCNVLINGENRLACQTPVDQDMMITLPQENKLNILSTGVTGYVKPDGWYDYVLAVDIGTTTIVTYLLDGKTGELIESESMCNPQTAYGADVISRIQYEIKKHSGELRSLLQNALIQLVDCVSGRAGIPVEEIGLISIACNTAMHHLLLGINPKPLTIPPYMPSIVDAIECSTEEILPLSVRIPVRILPNIAGFIGGDTVACMLAINYDHTDALTLMIDVGTNGEMVLGNRTRRVACSTAAGPAFEGAKILHGMRGAVGAIDHVTIQNGTLCVSVIGGGEAVGICGSGLLDAVAAMLQLELLDESGRMCIENGDPESWITMDGCKAIRLTKNVVLTQKDIREVQLAKAAIRAGIELMIRYYRASAGDIEAVYLAGAFGNYLDPVSACAIGMFPPKILDRIVSIGNAAGEGAKRVALCEKEFERSRRLARETEFLELASLPEFQDCFVDCLSFSEDMME